MSQTKKPSADRLRRLVADGLTAQQIALRVGASPRTVNEWLKDEGLAVDRIRQKPIGQWEGGAHAPRIKAARNR